ncbi:MAG: NAD(P)/FAD-dependent oxidoreductase [Parvibaculaceae bacterium]|nr:NAD(P)/FAD-dependent oxidoreductase [Parvibaculaceae bacterium]
MQDQKSSSQQVDAIVVGAGFGGMYMTHLLVEKGLSVRGFERGDDVGGTWYWNRYPGCRCDVESMEYSYKFSDELQREWEWSERYSPQPEILAYANHVADRFDLRRHFAFQSSVTSATYSEADKVWVVATDTGDRVSARYLIMATGCLSAANIPNFPGLADFSGPTYHTGAWPKEGVDFSGQRVAVIGTGSSGIQSIPFIADQAKHLTVFQRTPNFSVPARNMPLDPKLAASIKADYAQFRAAAYQQPAAFGAHFVRREDSVLDVTPEERDARFEEYWGYGGFQFLSAFGDIGASPETNKLAADFVRKKIREIVKDPETADILCPDSIIGCKRLVADSGYFETYNRANVDLVDVSASPIERFTAAGLETKGQSFEFDAVVFATGFDAMTGALLQIDIQGRAGLSLKEKWSAGPRTYLGLASAGFPNLFMMTGPGSPSVLANMVTGIEQHAEYIAAAISWADERNLSSFEAETDAESKWVEVVNMRSEATLYPQCNSWYLGANVPGKPRVFMPFIGFPDYVAMADDVAAKDYEGFAKA